MDETNQASSLNWQKQIQDRINSGFDTNELEAAYEKAQIINADNTDLEGAVKVGLTLGLYGGFYGLKSAAKLIVFNNALGSSGNQTCTPQESLLKILDSFFGRCNKNSTKYNLISCLFGVNAKDDKEAEKMIDYTVEKLKNYNTNHTSQKINMDNDEFELNEKVKNLNLY